MYFFSILCGYNMTIYYVSVLGIMYFLHSMWLPYDYLLYEWFQLINTRVLEVYFFGLGLVNLFWLQLISIILRYFSLSNLPTDVVWIWN